jgi:hypothetical protein
MTDTPISNLSTAAQDPSSPRLKWQQLLGSRKFWAALTGLALVIIKAFRPDFPIQEEQLTNLIYVLVAYILGVALEDGLTQR